MLCARLLSIAVCIALCVGGIATCLCCLYLLWLRRRHLLALVLMAGLLCGGVLGFAQGIRLHQAQQAALESQGQMHITALSDGVKGEFGASCTARVQVEGSSRSFTAKVAFPSGSELPFYGERIAGYGSVSELSQDRASWGWQRGIAANVTLRTCENVTLQGPGAALLPFGSVLYGRSLSRCAGIRALQRQSPVVGGQICRSRYTGSFRPAALRMWLRSRVPICPSWRRSWPRYLARCVSLSRYR